MNVPPQACHTGRGPFSAPCRPANSGAKQCGRTESAVPAAVSDGFGAIVLKNSDLVASSPLSRGSHKIHRNKFNDLAGHENGEIAAKSVKIDFSGVFQHYRVKADTSLQWAGRCRGKFGCKAATRCLACASPFIPLKPSHPGIAR